MLKSMRQREMNFKAILFDLDGTLLNTLDDLADSMNAVLTRSGFKPHDVEAYKYFVGNGMETLVRRVLPEKNRDISTLSKCKAQMEEEYLSRWADKTRTYDGVPELLNGLTFRNIKMAILSNKPHSFVRISVARFLKPWSFEAVFGARDSCPKKPDPTAAEEICALLNLSPREVIYAGDSNTDMLTARRADMFAVGVLWGFRLKAELINSGAHEVVKYPTELLKFF